MALDQHLDVLYKVASKQLDKSEWDDLRNSATYVDLSEADLSHLELAGLTFDGADLTSARMFNTNLEGASMRRCTLSFADLRRANLAKVKLQESNLSGANLSGANMVETQLQRVNLQSAIMAGVHLINGDLTGAYLTKADLRGATFKMSRFRGAQLAGANVEDADFTRALISDKQLKDVKHLDRALINDRQRPKEEEEETAQDSPAAEINYDYLFQETDCFKILGVDADASMEEIARAYRKRVMEYHPDRVNNLGEKIKEVARREFERIQNAYKSLSRHQSRPDVEIAIKINQNEVVRTSNQFTLEQYEALSLRFPDDSRILFNLGNKYMESNLYAQAVKTFKRVMELDPENASAVHNLKIANLLLQI
ncbi:pentapeptide repeat-containing protein [Candidatus Sumerlaeota bacterium]|nr:pentapeptide repeat-containing protein [Candidatus Sumerlaeota bacterium]